MRARFGLIQLLAVAATAFATQALAEAAMIREQKVIGRLAGFPRNAGGVVHSIPRSST
jgi:hypothetical protein